MSTAVRFRIGTISAQTHSARGLRQCGHSALAGDDDGSGMRRLYAAASMASIVLRHARCAGALRTRALSHAASEKPPSP
jgi:hypothetical protein